MTWNSPFFLHVRVPAGTVTQHLPPGLSLETDGGDAFVSLVALGAIGPAPGPISQTRLGRLFEYRQLNVRTYVNGPHGPGLFFLDVRVDRLFALGGRAFGLPYHLDRKLAFSADSTGVALRADGVAVKGLPAPGEAQPLADELENRLLDRFWSYSKLPAGALGANRVAHDPWKVRRVELDPDLRLGLDRLGLPGDVKPFLAQLGETMRVEVAELKIYRGAPFKEARAAG
jgi:uncharacterized protein YqjF (DUF2071 family)